MHEVTVQGGCAGCAARQQQIDFLQAQLDKANDRLMSVVHPPVRDQPAPTPTIAGEPAVVLDGAGRAWVNLGGRGVPLEEYQEFIKERGKYVTANGDAVSAEEADRALNKLDEMLAGRRAGE